MNEAVRSILNSDHPPLTLRPEQPEDEAFLLELYTSTRQEELDLTGWDAATRAAFVKMQFNAMRLGYAGMFPHAQFSILLSRGRAIGRMVVHQGETEIRLVDLALMPTERCRGFGTRLVQTLQDEARQSRKPVCLYVLKMNRAVRLYERLGFERIGDDGLYEEMTWKPSV